MAQVTVEEPKSVVEEVQMYECDSCGYRSEDGDDFETDFRFDGAVDTKTAPTASRQHHTFHLCAECSGTDRHASYMDKVDKRKHRVRTVVKGLNISYNGLWTVIGSMCGFIIFGIIYGGENVTPTSYYGALFASFIVSLVIAFLSTLVTIVVFGVISELLDIYGYEDVEVTYPSITFK